jgi:hypothetical protein
MRLPDGSRIDIGIYLFFAPALAVEFTLTSASALTFVLLMPCEVEFVVAAVVDFAVEVVALAVEAVACAVARVAAEDALSALLTDGVLMVAAELNLAELPRPSRTWAKE